MVQARFVVIEGPPGSGERLARELAAVGVEVVGGFARRPAPGRAIVCHGVVGSAADAAAALLAAIDGCGLLVEASADSEAVDRLVDDLRRLGPVEQHTWKPNPLASLDRHGREILGLLAEGMSLGEAAATLGIARRTADRRLADARRVLGAERTTEAIAIARRRGLL